MRVISIRKAGLRGKVVLTLLVLCLFIFWFFTDVSNYYHQLNRPEGDRGGERADEKVRADSPFGEFLSWNEVDGIFKKYDQARVVDFDTGMSFAVQRRAGSLHADVQPLSAQDTAVMKKIYKGRWSWRRKAIIVEVKGRRIAASMNGMPHGAGAIGGNNFAGHFCIHFRDSRTHSRQENLAHQLMTWKAAGKVNQMLAGEGPEQILKTAFTAIEQGDPRLALLFMSTAPEGEKEAMALLEKVKWLAFADMQEKEAVGDRRSYEVTVTYGLEGGAQAKTRKLTVTMVRAQGLVRGELPWKADAGFLKEIADSLAEPGGAGAILYNYNDKRGMLC